VKDEVLVAPFGRGKEIEMPDPVEELIAEGLTRAGVKFLRHGLICAGLDFYLPDFSIWIEVKRFHSPRIAEQMSRVPNVIVIQGLTAALVFVALINRGF
jgi:hypothetical protein